MNEKTVKPNATNLPRREEKTLKHEIMLEEGVRVKSMYDLLPPMPEMKPFYMEGGFGLTTEELVGAEQWRRERENIFHKVWIPVDHVSRLNERNRFATVNIAGTPILLVHGESGIRGFHNLCRHRGMQLVDECTGKRAKFVCPYHHWVYDSNADLVKLLGTYFDHMFDPKIYGLVPVHTEVRDGIVFVCLADEPPSLVKQLGEFNIFAHVYELEDLVVTKYMDYEVNCNWKLIVHNVNECLHFPAAHNDLHKVTDYDDAGSFTFEGDILGAWQQIREKYNSISLSGQSARTPLSRVPEEDLQRVNWIAIMPNLLVAFTADYVTLQWAWPIDEHRSYVRHFWLFHPDEIAQEDFSHDEVFNLWDKANQEDWELCEKTHQGIQSNGWRPGPYSLDEEVLYDFDRYIRRMTGRSLGRKTPANVIEEIYGPNAFENPFAEAIEDPSVPALQESISAEY